MKNFDDDFKTGARKFIEINNCSLSLAIDLDGSGKRWL